MYRFQQFCTLFVVGTTLTCVGFGRLAGQEPAYRPPQVLHNQTPYRGNSQEILELRAKLGGGLSKGFSDAGLSQLAEQAFAQELERLQKNEAGKPSESPKPPTIQTPSYTGPISPTMIPPKKRPWPQVPTPKPVRFRQLARGLEELASEMEGDELYELADRLREDAKQLRVRAREINK